MVECARIECCGSGAQIEGLCMERGQQGLEVTL